MDLTDDEQVEDLDGHESEDGGRDSDDDSDID